MEGKRAGNRRPPQRQLALPGGVFATVSAGVILRRKMQLFLLHFQAVTDLHFVLYDAHISCHMNRTPSLFFRPNQRSR
jgi:hypothetical protein